MFKKIINFIKYHLNVYIPMFAKDSFYQYCFETNNITLIDYIYDRKYEMQYYCDFDKEIFYTRYSKYLYKKEIGMLIYSNNYLKEHILFNNDYKNLRIFQGEIFTSSNGKLYSITKNKIYDLTICEDFDFINYQDEYYILSGLKISKIINFETLELKELGEITFDNDVNIRNNFSFCLFNNEIYLVCREGKKQAYDTKIVLYKSDDLFNYKFKEVLVDSKNTKDIGIDGVGFPVIREINDKLRMVFVAYWGKHLFRQKTINYWKNI